MKLFFNILKNRKRKRRILFAGVCPANFVQFAPIYNKLKQDSRIEIYLSGMHHGKDRPLQLYRPFGLEEKFVIREKKAKRLQFDMYMSPDFHLVGNKHSSSIQLFHTTSFRNFSVNKEAKEFSNLFLIGPYMKRKFQEAGIFKNEEHRFEEVGMPQTDALLSGADPALHEKMRLNRAIPAVLFAPVWVGIESFLKDVQLAIETLASLEINLLVKMHDKFYYKELNKLNWREYLKTLLAKNKNMRLINDFDIIPYMRISNLLVSDVSAVIHQFSILDRPIVCLKIDIDKFKKSWPNLDEQAYAARAVAEAAAGEPLKETLMQELAQPARLSQKRLAMCQEYFYNIGSSTKYAVKKIYQFLNLERKEYA